MRRFVFCILPLVTFSCTRDLSEISNDNTLSFSEDNTKFFPAVLQKSSDTTIILFNEIGYTKVLRQLGEESLIERFLDKDVIRLTVFQTFDPHFTIRIERLGNGNIRLVEKETYKGHWGTELDSTQSYVVQKIVYDSVSNSYFHFKVRERWKDDSIEYLFKRPVDPITMKKETALTNEDWNSLLSLLDQSHYYSMPAQITRLGFDGSHYLIETHSRSGYYVVDRWSPDKGHFKDLVNHMLHLAGRRTEN